MAKLRFSRSTLEARLRGIATAWRSPRIVGPILERVGLYARTQIVRNFRAQGTLFGSKWKGVSWVTALLRKGGKFNAGGFTAAMRDPQAFVKATWEAINKRAAKSRPLGDTGDLERSFLGTGRGAVLTVEGLKVHVGSNLSYAEIHQKGGSKKFELTEEMIARVAKTIPPSFPGSPPEATRSGNDSYAKARWNPAFFSVLGALKKMDGTRRTIPQRKMVPDRADLKPDQIQHMEKIVTDGFSKVKITDKPGAT